MFDVVWLRPLWLLALLPWLLALLVYCWRGTQSSAWENEVDPALRAYVIEPGQTRRRFGPWALFAAWWLTLMALAGPVWQQQDLPVFDANPAEVLVFDLSNSMLIDDVKPSRLARARFLLRDLLDAGTGVDQALIGFSERPYVISPLTDDSETIAAFTPSLTPDIMPAQGSRVDLALDGALVLLEGASAQRAHVILISDADIRERDLAAARRLHAAGHLLSVVVAGTPSGGALQSADGRVYNDRDGHPIVVPVDVDALDALAVAGGGLRMDLQQQTRTVQRLVAMRQQLDIVDHPREERDVQQYWVEWGPWATLLLAVGALGLFRRGAAV